MRSMEHNTEVKEGIEKSRSVILNGIKGRERYKEEMERIIKEIEIGIKLLEIRRIRGDDKEKRNIMMKKYNEEI